MEKMIGNLYKTAVKVKSRQDIPIREIEKFAKEIGVKNVYVFENILTFERLTPEVKEFAISKINEPIFDKISENTTGVTFIKSYLIDNWDFSQTIIVIFF